MRRARSRDCPNFPTIAADQPDNIVKSVNLSEAQTKQVKDTVTRWGKTPEPTVSESLLRSQTPTRNIGDTFADNKMSSEPDQNSGINNNAANQSSGSAAAAPWRTKTAAVAVEPSVKVVNVAVDNNANMHFSESAEALMAKHLKQTAASEVKQTTTLSTSMMSTSTLTSEHQEEFEQKTTMTTSSVVSQPPPRSPAPSKKGKSSAANLARPPPPPTSQPPLSTTSSNEKTPAAASESAATSKAISTTSSGQVSMLNSILSSQHHQHQEYHETTSSSNVKTQVQSNSTILEAAPVLSGWLAAEVEPKKVEVDKNEEPSVKSDQPDLTSNEKIVEDDNRSNPAVPAAIKEAPAAKIIVDNKDFLEVRSKMLQEVASLRNEQDDDSSEDFSTSQEKAADLAKNERNRELAEIAEMRCRSRFEQVSSAADSGPLCKSGSNKSIDPELEEARSTIRNAAAKWQEREQSQQKSRYGTPPSGRNTPSRRIGSLFKKGSDHWSMDDAPGDQDEDQLPPPPTEIEMEVSLPAPPPRDSSKDVMMEYSDGKRK